jgi:hypothetical protein
MTIDAPFEIRTENLPNKSVERYSYANLLTLPSRIAIITFKHVRFFSSNS